MLGLCCSSSSGLLQACLTILCTRRTERTTPIDIDENMFSESCILAAGHTCDLARRIPALMHGVHGALAVDIATFMPCESST